MKLKIGQKTKCLCHMLKDFSEKNIDKVKNIKHIEIIIPVMIGILMSILVGVRYVSNERLMKALNDMYYLDLVEAKDRYLLLEVETNPLLKLDREDKDLELAVLHLKSGEIYNASVDTKNNLFVIDNANKLLESRVFKYNKTVEMNLKEEKANEEKIKDIENETKPKETNIENETEKERYIVLELTK